MKNIRIISILSFVFLVSNCQKEEVDYRNKYIGNWEFTVIRNEFLMSTNDGNDGYNRTDTIKYLGKIEKGDLKNEIKMQYTNDNLLIVEINETGEFIFPPPRKSGNFDGTNKVNIYLFWGGQGGGTTHRIDGIKL